MVSLEKVRKQNGLTLQELGVAINSLEINPEGGKMVTPAESKRVMDWSEGYHRIMYKNCQ